MDEPRKTVAIIGAGVAGIVCAKTAIESGFLPTVYDKSGYVGGLWSPAGYTWTNMHTNAGNHCVSFADFPWPKDSLIFPKSRQVYEYLLEYINFFKIHDRFVLNTQVESVKLLNDKRWKITTVCNNQRSVQAFDFCIVSNGFNSQPNLPEDFLNAKHVFEGVVLHSAEYRSNDDRLKDRNVIVVGSSFSAAEISSSLVGHSKSITNLLKNKYLILPKIVRENTKDGNVKPYSSDVPIFSREFYQHSLIKKPDNPFLKETYGQLCPIQTDKSKSDPELFIDLNNTDISELKWSLSEEFIDYVQSSKIKAKHGYITSFRPDGVVTNDGTFIEADVIIFCTSYRINLPFLDQETLKILNYDERYLNDPIALYKNTWHPDLPNLAFVGLVQSAICIVGELQAKWVFKVFKGDLNLPRREAMLESIQIEVQKREKNINIQFPYPFMYLCDMFATEAGLLDLEKEKRENLELYKKLWSGPILPEHFQLNDPDQRDAAIRRIESVNAHFNREFSPKEADVITVQNFV